MAGRLLGRDLAERDIRSTQDRAVIEHLLNAALDDLCGELDRALSEAAGRTTKQDPAADFTHTIPIGCGDIPSILALEISAATLAAVAKGWAGKPRAMPPEPGALRDILQDLGLRLSARLGSIKLPLSELDRLEVGDVVTLDLPVSDPLDAMIDGRCAGSSALSILPQENRIMFQIERAAIQW